MSPNRYLIAGSALENKAEIMNGAFHIAAVRKLPLSFFNAETLREHPTFEKNVLVLKNSKNLYILSEAGELITLDKTTSL